MPVLTVIQHGKSADFSFEGKKIISDVLAEHGYFVPHLCGGRGNCKKCTVLLDGKSVLACQQMIDSDCTVSLPDKEEISTVTAEEQTNRVTDNICLCFDIGTTTLALSLVSIDEGSIIKTVTSPNPQRMFGADVISRINYCIKRGIDDLHSTLISQLKIMINELLSAFNIESVDTMYVAGNTTMLHTFFGVDCASLGASPYTPVFIKEKRATGKDLGLDSVLNVHSLEGISAFVGADIVAGIGYIGLPNDKRYRILLDLGTNAEVALFSKDTIYCTAAAAGPCFEGANISSGMSASAGAISACHPDGTVNIIGGGKAKGLCATGLVDAIAEARRREDIDETGFVELDPITVFDEVILTGKDIREFQLAKSAIHASIDCLISEAGITFDDVEMLYIAGGFSAGLNIENSVFIGLLPAELKDRVKGINNASLLGTVKFACGDKKHIGALDKATYVDLSARQMFSDLFMEYMSF